MGIGFNRTKFGLAIFVSLALALPLTAAAQDIYFEGFENTSGATYTSATPALPGATAFAYEPAERYFTGAYYNYPPPPGEWKIPDQGEGLVFDVNAPSGLRLESVAVALQSPGTVQINLWDSGAGGGGGGTPLDFATRTFNSPGYYDVELDFIIPAGTNYTLTAYGTDVELYVIDPYSSWSQPGGHLEITGSTDPNRYYYLYSWQAVIQSSNGRLRLNAGPGFTKTGNYAATLDRFPADPGQEVYNDLTWTVDMSGYQAANDRVVLSFSVMRHGDEPDWYERIAVMGNTQQWIELTHLYDLTPTSGVYYDVDVPLSDELLDESADFSNPFKVRFFQVDDRSATSTTEEDGYSLDDIRLHETVCGDSVIDPGEQCDDGNTIDCDTCSNDCRDVTGCGDQVVCGGEDCDDGNSNDCDSCSNDCKQVTGCGDGVLCGSDWCDDGNTIDCDGCSSSCVYEFGCGDGSVCGNEDCDDANPDDCDYCSNS